MELKTSKHLQIGKAGELLAKAEFIIYGFDVYSTEVDDKGIDFVVRNTHGHHFDIQVKTTNENYVFMKERFFKPSENLYLFLIIFSKHNERIFALIPSVDWANNTRDFLRYKDYVGLKSEPEYGVNLSVKTISKIKEDYLFENTISRFSL